MTTPAGPYIDVNPTASGRRPHQRRNPNYTGTAPAEAAAAAAAAAAAPPPPGLTPPGADQPARPAGPELIARPAPWPISEVNGHRFAVSPAGFAWSPDANRDAALALEGRLKDGETTTIITRSTDGEIGEMTGRLGTFTDEHPGAPRLTRIGLRTAGRKTLTPVPADDILAVLSAPR